MAAGDSEGITHEVVWWDAGSWPALRVPPLDCCGFLGSHPRERLRTLGSFVRDLHRPRSRVDTLAHGPLARAVGEEPHHVHDEPSALVARRAPVEPAASDADWIREHLHADAALGYEVADHPERIHGRFPFALATLRPLPELSMIGHSDILRV